MLEGHPEVERARGVARGLRPDDGDSFQQKQLGKQVGDVAKQ